MKLYVKSSYQIPQEGVFWVINNELIQFSDDATYKNLSIDPIDFTHQEIWKQIGKDFKIDGHLVPFDYFPRGRVVVSKTSSKYDVEIFIDRCIKNEWWGKVLDSFDISNINCNIIDGGNSGFFNSVYKCHDCR